jgi:4-hydroxy-tetrahydrodipicolinate reductase
MKKINLAISGCMGRMGQQLIKSSKKNKNFKLVTLTENKLVNKKFNGIKPELNSDKAFKKIDVIIDFTVPECTLEILKIASNLKKRLLLEQRVLVKNKKTKSKNIQKNTYFKSWKYELRSKFVNVFNRDCIKIIK